MTKIICSITRSDGPLYFECRGHSDYTNDMTGNNDVCVSVSVLCNTFVRYLVQEGYEPAICEDGHIKIDIGESNIRINEVCKAIMLEFSALAKDYPEHIKLY